MSWSSALHPRVPAGSPPGGQFTAGSSKSGGAKAAPSGARKATAKGTRKTAAKPRAARQPSFKTLQKLEHKAQHGGKLTARQEHELHVAHVAHVEHVAAEKARTAAAKTVARRPAPAGGGKAAPVKVTAAQRAAFAASVAGMR